MIGALRIGVEYLAQTVIGLRLRGAVIAGRCAGQEQQGNQKKQNRQRPVQPPPSGEVRRLERGTLVDAFGAGGTKRGFLRQRLTAVWTDMIQDVFSHLSKRLYETQDVLIAFLGIDVGTAPDDPAQPSPCQLFGRMLAGQHDIDEDAEGIDVAADVCLR